MRLFQDCVYGLTKVRTDREASKRGSLNRNCVSVCTHLMGGEVGLLLVVQDMSCITRGSSMLFTAWSSNQHLYTFQFLISDFVSRFLRRNSGLVPQMFKAFIKLRFNSGNQVKTS